MIVKELRVGNLVYFLGNIHEIEGISRRLRPDVGHFELSNIEHAQKGFHIKFIPLTEEWILRYGFEKINASGLKYYNNGKINIALDFSINFDAGQRVYLKYVHELQNIYIDLIKEELILKTPNSKKHPVCENCCQYNKEYKVCEFNYPLSVAGITKCHWPCSKK